MIDSQKIIGDRDKREIKLFKKKLSWLYSYHTHSN
jgi:hypothetical protein